MSDVLGFNSLLKQSSTGPSSRYPITSGVSKSAAITQGTNEVDGVASLCPHSYTSRGGDVYLLDLGLFPKDYARPRRNRCDVAGIPVITKNSLATTAQNLWFIPNFLAIPLACIYRVLPEGAL